MPADKPSEVYRVQLLSQSLSHGYALWNPEPVKNTYDKVSIGDVGYVNCQGSFHRMFNVTLPWDDPSNNKLGTPEQYQPLGWDPFANIREKQFNKGDYYSPNVSSERNSENPSVRDPAE